MSRTFSPLATWAIAASKKTVRSISLIQRGTIVIADTDSSNTATISSVDTTRSVESFLGCSAEDTNVPSALARITLTNATTVTANRFGTVSATTVGFMVTSGY